MRLKENKIQMLKFKYSCLNFLFTFFLIPGQGVPVSFHCPGSRHCRVLTGQTVSRDVFKPIIMLCKRNLWSALDHSEKILEATCTL